MKVENVRFDWGGYLGLEIEEMGRVEKVAVRGKRSSAYCRIDVYDDMGLVKKAILRFSRILQIGKIKFEAKVSGLLPDYVDKS